MKIILIYDLESGEVFIYEPSDSDFDAVLVTPKREEESDEELTH